MSTRTGTGYDSHRLDAGRPLILGGVRIPDAARGLTGHSDADVLTHAVIDALLGAAGLGDIGHHFPDTDDRFKDADSLALLAETRNLLSGASLKPVHVDATVIAEAPKLGPYRDAMAEALAGALGVAATAVNVKFTTNEGMGFLGRGEGMAAMAVANLEAA
ncbi:MAG TPA: 2-C-methyl-D-erythritol 2,4-cyclodiphosphate synthase [Thermoleophilaceae bacterium]|nr:2-C-methyl-D-erythritol 2,4-cyclodiphosphate synthase [Thermoleophilaceae bacterium]